MFSDIVIRTINFSLSKETGHIKIYTGASEYFDELRREFANACHLLPELRAFIHTRNSQGGGKIHSLLHGHATHRVLGRGRDQSRDR